MDKLEEMIGSYGPSPEPVVKKLVAEESCVDPPLLSARSSLGSVASRRPLAVSSSSRAAALTLPPSLAPPSSPRRSYLPPLLFSPRLHPARSPSGMIARSGSYTVRSRVIDDDKHVHCDFEWVFKLAKEW